LTVDRRPLLNVVIDDVAALRQLSLLGAPDLIEFARAVEAAGASGVSARLRSDRSAIQDRDLEALARADLKSWSVYVAPHAELVRAAAAAGARRCCFVPESRHEHGGGGALDISVVRGALTGFCEELRAAHIEVAAHIDPEPGLVASCIALGLNAVEIHCGAYSLAVGERVVAKRLARIRVTAEAAASAGLKVFARGGLDRNNVASIAEVAAIDEVRVGHAIVADCLFHGIDRTVAAWLSAIDGVLRQ
jgi:pyridoxine 5-phosphate synthase